MSAVWHSIYVFFCKSLAKQKVSEDSKIPAEPAQGNAKHAINVSRHCLFYEGSY
jgi:hypothetical protein